MKDKRIVMNELGSWYESLGPEAKNDVAVFCVIGDMAKKENADFMVGSTENLIITLAQAMMNDKEFYAIVKDSVALYDRFIAKELAKVGTSTNKNGKIIVS